MEVQHFSTIKDGRFFVEINTDKHKILQAELHYIKQGNVMDIHHTFVPEELRGKGLAEKLAKSAFDYAKKYNMKIKPTCSYIEDTFLKAFRIYDVSYGYLLFVGEKSKMKRIIKKICNLICIINISLPSFNTPHKIANETFLEMFLMHGYQQSILIISS